MKGRPRKDHSNNWNPVWYQQLRKQAMYVLKSLGFIGRQYDLDDLINEAWISSARRIDPDIEILPYTKRIRCFMRYSVNGGVPRQKEKEMQIRDGEAVLEAGQFAAPNIAIDMVDAIDELNQLDARLQDCLIARNLMGMSYKEIGMRHGITKQRVSQLLK